MSRCSWLSPRATLIRTTPVTTLVPCVDAGAVSQRSVAAIVRWQDSFACAPPEVVGVITPGADAMAVRGAADAMVGRLGASGVVADRRLVEAVDPVIGLESVTSGFVNPVYVATSSRYPHEYLHLFSTTQRLVQAARCPVLVVPSQPATTRSGCAAMAPFGAVSSSS